MNTRERILEAVRKNQPAATALPDITMFKGDATNIVQKYVDVFKGIGGSPVLVNDVGDIKSYILTNFDTGKRIVTRSKYLEGAFETIATSVDAHSYEDVELAIVNAQFAVAENGAVWLTEEEMVQRIIPYICQHLAVIVTSANILPTLHEAYERIGAGDYGFGGFIGGPSKTADIEQALVLGAHGPLTMTVFIINEAQ